MILINLLPHREAARKRRKEQFVLMAVLAAVFGSLICLTVYSWYQRQIENQKSNNAYLKSETEKLDEQIKDIAGLQAEINALKARQKAVEDLQSDRNTPVHLVNELAMNVPDGIYLSALRQEEKVITMSGVAQSQERVSELLRNIAASSAWLESPELVEIVSGVQVVSSREQRRVFNFIMRANIVRGEGKLGKKIMIDANKE